MQWLQDPDQSYVDNQKNARRDASRHFRNIKTEYLAAKIDKREANSKIKNIRDLYPGISNFKKGYQPRTNRATEEKGDLITDFHSILARWRNHFSQLFSVNGVRDVRQTEIHTAEPLVHEPRAFEVEMAIEKPKRHKSPGIDQIPAEKFALKSLNLLILFGIKGNCLRSGRSRSLYLFIRREMQQIVVIIWAYHFCQTSTKFYPTSYCQG